MTPTWVCGCLGAGPSLIHSFSVSSHDPCKSVLCSPSPYERTDLPFILLIVVAAIVLCICHFTYVRPTYRPQSEAAVIPRTPFTPAEYLQQTERHGSCRGLSTCPVDKMDGHVCEAHLPRDCGFLFNHRNSDGITDLARAVDNPEFIPHSCRSPPASTVTRPWKDNKQLTMVSV